MGYKENVLVFWVFSFAGYRSEALSFSEADDGSLPVVCPFSVGHRRGGPRRKRIDLLSADVQDPGGDVFCVFSPGSFVVSDRCVDVFESAKGVDVAVLDSPPGWRGGRLYDVQVKGWVLPPQSADVRRVTVPCRGCGLAEYSYPPSARDLLSPEGAAFDLFQVWPFRGLIFASAHVIDVLRGRRIKGARILDPQNVPVSLTREFSVGPPEELDPEGTQGLKELLEGAPFE